MQLLCRLVVFYIFFLLASFSALAGEARIGVPSYALRDPFVQTLQNASSLKESGVEIKFIEYSDPAKLLDSVLTGSSNLALVSLETISRHKFDSPPDLVPIFTRPFIFEKTQEAFAVQEAPLGAAVLSDLNRTGLVPLGFWNQGTSQLISNQPIAAIPDVRGAKVLTSQNSTVSSIFSSNGASISTISATQIGNALNTGQANLALVDAIPNGSINFTEAKFFSTLRPLVGALVADRKYWSNLSESERRAWHFATISAEDAAKKHIIENEIIAEKGGKRVQLQLDKEQKVLLLRNYEPDLNRLKQQIDLVEQSLATIRKQDQKKKSEIRPVSVTPPIVYATDRDDENTSDIETRFGIRRTLNWGPSCGEVGFSRISSTSQGPGGPNVADSTIGLPECARLIADQLRKRRSNRILFFIHGYKNTFKDAVARGIRLSEITNYPGIVLIWSWPSDGWTSSYPFDEEAADWSRNHLAPLISSLLKEAPEAKFDLVAHSLGNRLLLHLLEHGGIPASHFSSVSFAAPDVASDIFKQSIAAIGSSAPLQTLYGSNSDAALFVSSVVHSPHEQRIRRAGDGGNYILILKNLESVDATFVRGGIINHSYVFDDPGVTSDFRQIVIEAKHAQERNLTPRRRGTDQYWEIKR